MRMKYIDSFLILSVGMFFDISQSFATQPDQKNLPIGFTEEELTRSDDAEEAAQTEAPVAPIHSLAEWEASDAAMTLWTNPSFVRALQQRGPVKLFADDENEKDWWQNWLVQNSIPSDKISYFVFKTDSIWIRDYGPWFVVDGLGKFGIVDTKYNRPRPNDDVVPGFIAKTMGLPLYQPGLVHTGGNYYNDGIENAFSSTLVYTENYALSAEDVRSRMKDYLGIERYTTSPLAPRITIEHLDTFGKLVAPDTWVFSDFPQGSQYRADSEKMLALLKTLKSPYGTPYKIFRLKMISQNKILGSEDFFRAYINSFISNHALYFPIYGDSIDETVKRVYQQALPGYDIVGVSALDTSWGDSVHCRARNLLTRNTILIFPNISSLPALRRKPVDVYADIIPSPGAEIKTLPQVYWRANDVEQPPLPMTHIEKWRYKAEIPSQAEGTKIALFIAAEDSAHVRKTNPIFAPDMMIDFVVAK